MEKMSLLHKISYSALFIALSMILSRFISFPYLFGLPFLKISLAPTIVMFSSIYLGPFWGLLVGTFADVFGALLFPQGGAFNPLFTIAAALTGLMPGLIYKILGNKIDKNRPISLFILLVAVATFVSLTFGLSDAIHSASGKTTYTLATWIRIVVPVLSVLLTAGFTIGIIFIKRKFKDKKINKFYNIYTIGTALYGTYFLFKIPVSSLVKSLILSYNFWFIFVTEILVGFMSCFVHLILVILCLNVSTMFNVKGELILEEK